MTPPKDDGQRVRTAAERPVMDLRDADGFDALYKQHWLSMVRLARLLVDDTSAAEDVVQDAFIALHRRRDSLLDQQAAVGYLRTAVVNGSRSALRRRAVVRRHARDLHDEPVDGAEAELMAKADTAAMLAAVGQLSRRKREVLVLRYWHDLSQAEIATTLGVSEGTVKSTASRALAALEKILESKP